MDNNSKILKMICYINDYESWNDTIYVHSCKFFESYSIHPNLMLASKVTWNKIDVYANLFNPDNIITPDDNLKDFNQDDKFKSISCFATYDFSLDFCLDEKMKDDYFMLVFDEEPIFDGEPYDINEDVVIYRRIA